MPCTEWLKLNNLQLGRYAEYYAKMGFASYGFEVFTSEVDDKGVDFICRKDGKWFEIQVKAMRNLNYIFMRKEHMDVENEAHLICMMRFEDNKLPEVYLIPAYAWKTPTPLLKSYDYIGKKSKAEWGINLTKKNLPLLQEYEISTSLPHLSHTVDNTNISRI